MVDALTRLAAVGQTPSDRALFKRALAGLDAKHQLAAKISADPYLATVMGEFASRLVDAFGSLVAVRDQAVLDIASGSNSSRSPITGLVTAAFEPWMCRLLAELAAHAVALDIGDLEGETFEHHRVDLGARGALDFMPSGSFDAIHESRLFGSPEFRAVYGSSTDRVWAEVHRQERRLLRPGGILIHSDDGGRAARAKQHQRA